MSPWFFVSWMNPCVRFPERRVTSVTHRYTNVTRLQGFCYTCTQIGGDSLHTETVVGYAPGAERLARNPDSGVPRHFGGVVVLLEVEANVKAIAVQRIVLQPSEFVDET